MKIAYNPKTAAVITTATAANNDILFDLNARKVWAKGLRMGADWADISSKPSSLKNPAALTTFGVVYDGSVAKTVNPTNFISLVNEAASTITDGTMLITSYASNNGFSDTNAVNIPYKRKASHLWDYIKTKTDALYSAIGHNHDGRYLRLSGDDTMTGQIKSNYHADTYINGCTNAIIVATYKGYNSLIAAPIKSGNVCISAWNAEDNLNFGYAKTGKTYNSFDKRMYWDAPNNNLHADYFTGHLSGTADNADTVDGEHASNFSYTHQTSFDFSKSKSGRIVTFDQSGTDYGWINGFASTHGNYLTSVIFNTHRTSNWYVGYIEANTSTGVTKGLTAVKQLAFLDSKVADSDKLDGIHASDLLTSVTNTNNGISVTVGGTTKSVSNISVNYASSATNADTVDNYHIADESRQVYKNYYTVTSPAGAWILIKFPAWNALNEIVSIDGYGANRQAHCVVHCGSRNQGIWGYQSEYNGLVVSKIRWRGVDSGKFAIVALIDDGITDLSIKSTNSLEISKTTEDTGAFNITGSFFSSSGVFHGNIDWGNITGKPSSYTPSAHTHAWNSLTHSSTTENQAILTNGKANGWKLLTLNIVNWDTAYNFVNTITGTDTDKVINKWDEIVNFLAGITEDNKLNTLLNSKLSVYELANKTNVGAIKNNGIYYSTTDASTGTLTNSPFNNGFTLINMTSYDGGDDLRRSRLAFNAYGEIKVSDDRDLANTAETWYNVLTSKNSGISGSTIKLNGTSITVYSSGTADGRYVKKSGDTMTGALNFANGTWNIVGDDVAMGDCNIAGCLGIKGLNANPGLAFYNSSNTLLSKLIGTANLFLRFSGNNVFNILDTSSTSINDNTITINGSSITVSKSDHTHSIYAVNENYNGFKKAERLPTSGFYQSNESESGGNAPWTSWMHLINCLHSNTGNNFALLIAASFFNNNTFKIRVTNNSVNNTWRDIIHSGNIGSQSVNYANSAGNATSATKVIVNLHTTNDINYPLVWSNLSNTSNVTENQLYKSWADLYYNPKNKKLVVGGSVSTAYINATGTVTSAGFKHSAVTKNANLYVLTADGGYTFLNLTSNELAHEFDVNITVTSEWTDIKDFYGGNLSFLTLPGTYIVLVYYKDASADGMYEGYFSGIMSWYTGKTNSNNADEIVLHRVGHAYANTIYLRTRESLSSEANPYAKLQISANSDLKQHTYKFKFKRIC